MGNFSQGFTNTMGHEGGYANDPDDTGGETYMGVSRVNNPNWRGWFYVDNVTRETRNVTAINRSLRQNKDLQVLVQSIYKKQYWDVLNLDLVPNEDMASKLFDISVNCGPGKAGQILQRALNLSSNNYERWPKLNVDGDVGNKTMSTLLTAKSRWQLVYWFICGLQFEHYRNLVENKPGQAKFAGTWLSRVGFEPMGA